jgi:prepilin-type N-terminal cleavage/methylation domain-containing protein
MRPIKAFNLQKNAGFTLIELLIGLTLGLMVIASTLTLYVITTKYYGFKRKENSIALRQDDNLFDCDSNYWEKITEENVTQITELSFSDTDSQCFNATTTSTGPCTTVEPAALSGNSITKISHITISLSGALVQDSTVTKRLDASVTVANPYTYVKP